MKKVNVNSVGYFEIQSSMPEREIQFYSSLFGWKFKRDNLTPVEYYRIETGNLNGGLLKRQAENLPAEFGTNAFVCSVQVEDFDIMSDKVLKNGGKIALPKFAIPGRCWQGYFIDQDNNTFGIFETDPDAK